MHVFIIAQINVKLVVLLTSLCVGTVYWLRGLHLISFSIPIVVVS